MSLLLVVSVVNAVIVMTVAVLPVVVNGLPLVPLVQKPKPPPLLLKSNRLLLLSKPKVAAAATS